MQYLIFRLLHNHNPCGIDFIVTTSQTPPHVSERKPLPGEIALTTREVWTVYGEQQRAWPWVGPFPLQVVYLIIIILLPPAMLKHRQ
jgi:hypothetical protein